MDALANALGAPLTFAEQLGLEPTSDVITFTVACKIVARMDPPNSMSRPLVLGSAPGKTKFIDLPLKDFEENKKIVEKHTDISNNKLRNRIAGYVTKLMKKKEEE